MLYLFHGTDTQTSANKAHVLVKSLRVKREDATFVEIDADHWNVSTIKEHAGGQGLFSAKYIIFLDRVSENASAKEEVVDVVDIMKESENIFIMLEGKLNADLKRGLEKHSDKTVVSDMKDASDKKSEFNVFALANALGERNALKSWSIYRQAIDAGQEIEGVVGMFFWKVKTLMTTDYVGKYSKDELKTLAGELITIYHDGHRGMTNIELAVEKLLLGLR